ncbi:uncharacterized protein ACR2FA_000652 [Aphomia sociella]
MTRGLLLLLAFCALAAAMVSRERRAVNTEDEEGTKISTTTQQVIYCEPQTPCAWSVYKPGLKFLAVNITNSYCICTPDTICQEHEDDTNVNAFVYRCRPPSQEEAEDSER